MENKITFIKDQYISKDKIESILNQLDTFHRFILINAQTVVGNSMRSFNRRTSKIIDAGNENKLILNISLQKKIDSDLEISYILKSSNGIVVVTSCQKYTNYDDIYKNLIYIINNLRELYTKEDTVENKVSVEEVAENEDVTVPVEDVIETEETSEE